MSDEDDATILRKMRERIRQLELENKEVKSENNLLKMKVHAADPICQQAPLHSHEFKMEVKAEISDIKSETFTVDGVEFSVRIERAPKKDGQKDNRFYSSLYVKSVDASKRKFALTTIEIREKERYGRGCFTVVLRQTTQRFVLSPEEEECGFRKAFQSGENTSTCNLTARITVAVQGIDPMELDDESTTVVVVKNTEFHVSAQYLSLWSRYFKAYFSADMKEKKAGKYPIKDKDISPADFEELLAVIYPTDKPITVHNYRKLLKLASRFEMPELTRRIECFLIDFERHDLEKAFVFRIATDVFQLKLVQSTLLHRWRDSVLLSNELLRSPEYEKLKTETKALVNERFVQACVARAEADERPHACMWEGSTQDGHDGDDDYLDDDDDDDDDDVTVDSDDEDHDFDSDGGPY